MSLTMLVDGPVLAGEYLKVVPLTAAENPPAELDVAADSAAALDAPAEVWEHYRNLVKQAGVLFGAHHYRSTTSSDTQRSRRTLRLGAP